MKGLAMAWPTPKLSYQKLRHEGTEDDHLCNLREKVIGKEAGRSSRCQKKMRLKNKKKKKIKIPCLSKLLRGKATELEVAWSRLLKRLGQSKSHFCDLFAGNYLFVQVTPTPLKRQRSFKDNEQYYSR